jgi:uncharacterized protein YecT (DUF1311 family)
MRILAGLVATLLAALAAAQTRVDMDREAGRRLADAAVELSRAIDVYRRRLDARQRDLFDRSQEQWMKHRDAACDFEASGVSGGSAHAVVHADCLTTHTRERLGALRRLSTCAEGDLSCPAFLRKPD